MHKYKDLGLILAYTIIVLVTFETSGMGRARAQVRKDACSSNSKNCSVCIQTPGCKWCRDSVYNDDNRCFSGLGTECKEIENPESRIISKVESNSTSLIEPSKLHVRLRRGKSGTINVSFEYTDEKNRPLDLYILMDLSCTMSKHKEKVAELVEDLAKKLRQNLTSNLKMGFGSFVDKSVLPFSSVKSTVWKCGEMNITDKPHLFKNHLKITSNITELKRIVNNTSILTNIDLPEGSLDALMQVVVCKDKLGWRKDPKTRRLIVLATDGPFHIAGDGKLGGIVLPNDGECHLNEKQEYDKATIHDYPSISQIRDKIVDNNVYVLFAVTKTESNRNKMMYEKLAERIGVGFSSVGSIDTSNASSITKVIEKEYEKVVNQVTFQSLTNGSVEVTFYTKCPRQVDYEKKATCDNILRGEKVQFKVELMLKECPFDRNLPKITHVIIQPSQSAGENLLNITVEMLCDCDCESEMQVPSQLRNTTKCNSHGHEQCGICKCDDGWGGQNCLCNTGDGQSKEREKCRNEKTGIICSNSGKCDCGQCICAEGSSGKYCECLESHCPYSDGEDKGICNKDLDAGNKCICGGKCNCSTEFTGSRCECPRSSVNCTDPQSVLRSSAEVCNGLGSCECAKCSCNKGYHGTFCATKYASAAFANTCQDTKILDLVKECVQCLSFKNPKGVENCKSECIKMKPKTQSVIEPRSPTECDGKVVDSSKCEVQFVVSDQNVNTEEISIRLETEPTCPPEEPIVSVILSVIGAMLLIGTLTLLIWKVLTHIHDKKEYEKFDRERTNATWSQNQNPLYKETVSEFQNPSYSTEN